MIYIASALDNWKRVADLRDKFQQLGINMSYDWTQHGADEVPEEAAVEYAIAELNGVKSASCVLLVTPGNRGTHWEAGYAYALNIPIIVLCDDRYIAHSTYNLPGVRKVFSEVEAINIIQGIESNYGFTEVHARS